jgi:ABC-type transport system involved in cytochrome bd biosynthesis fused ATPase/permease subunit
LDEPLANLDVESREYLKSSILTFSHQKTVLVITHQLSDLDWTDEIVVLDRGSVIEQGTWKSLLYTKSQFQAMLALQRRIIPVDQA